MTNGIPENSEAEGPEDLSSLTPIQQQHETSRARYNVLKDASSKLDLLRREFDKLSLLGDTISPNDVVKAFSTFVGAGANPHEMAVILSGMPTSGGEMLQQWVQTHDQQTRAMEAQVGPALASARHRMSVDALHVMMEHHLGTAATQSVAPGAGQQASPGSRMGLGGPPQAGGPPLALSPSSPTVGRA